MSIKSRARLRILAKPCKTAEMPGCRHGQPAARPVQ